MSITTTTPAQTSEGEGTNTAAVTGSVPPTQPQGGNDEKTFNQQAVNALIGARLKEARQQWEKDQRDAAETAEAEKRGEYEKVLAKERERADAAEQRAKEIEDAARQRILASEIRSVAAELHFANPAVAHRLIEPAAVEFNDAGAPTNVRPLLEKLAKDEPYLVGIQQNGTRQPIPGTPNPSELTQEQFRAQEKERALRSGKYSAL